MNILLDPEVNSKVTLESMRRIKDILAVTVRALLMCAIVFTYAVPASASTVDAGMVINVEAMDHECDHSGMDDQKVVSCDCCDSGACEGNCATILNVALINADETFVVRFEATTSNLYVDRSKGVSTTFPNRPPIS